MPLKILSRVPGVDSWAQEWRRRDSLRQASRCVEAVRPDIVHVHGTESDFGLLGVRGQIKAPLLVSIQGIMSECAKHAWGDKSIGMVLRECEVSHPLRAISLLMLRRELRKRAELEEQIISHADGVLGRTDWDRSYVWSVSAGTRYFHVDELIRPEFHGAVWELASAQAHRVYTSGRLTFAKGMHVFLDAMAILRREFPDLSVHIAGENSPTTEYRSLVRQMNRQGLSECVTFTGWIPGPSIVEQLRKAHVYANASFIENGCNALQEAMLMGVPCVATFAGGMATTLEHRRTGLLIPRCDAFMLADAVRQIFLDEELAARLGTAARQVACSRHATPTVVECLMESYRRIATCS